MKNLRVVHIEDRVFGLKWAGYVAKERYMDKKVAEMISERM